MKPKERKALRYSVARLIGILHRVGEAVRAPNPPTQLELDGIATDLSHEISTLHDLSYEEEGFTYKVVATPLLMLDKDDPQYAATMKLFEEHQKSTKEK